MLLPKIVAAACMAAALAACAKSADQIAASYVSPIPYEVYSCAKIAAEAQRVTARAGEIAGVQNQKASADAGVVAIGLIVFWPALFLVHGNDEQTGELARLKGELEALEQASIQKNCGIQFQRPVPPGWDPWTQASR